MKNVSVKIVLASALVALVSTIIPRFILKFVYGGVFPDPHSVEVVDTQPFLVGGILSVGISIALFIWIINRIIIKRIKRLNEATMQVSKGVYDFEIEYKHNDELSNLSRNFNSMLKELKSNEYLNKEFIRNFTHEFKTPISAIKGYSDLISTVDLTEEERLRYLGIISSESERLANLASNMLNISLIDSKSIIKTNDKFSLAEQIRNIIQIYQLDWEKRNLEFKLEFDEITVVSNKELTYQIWSNLIGNAIKYSNSSSVISMKLSKNEDEIEFEITSSGDHLDEETKEKIFELFYVHSDKSKGTGVGLTLTKKIVEKLKGSITFDSSNTGQNTFRVILPSKTDL